MPFRKNVYILGAGASADAGAPVMETFLNRIRDFRDMKHPGLTKEDLEAFERVLAYRAALDKAMARVFLDPENIEDLFGMIEMECGLGRSDPALRAAIIRVISRTLILSTEKPLSGTISVLLQDTEGAFVQNQFPGNPYSLFLWLVTDALRTWPPRSEKIRDSIISFNYDLVLERDMGSCEITPEYGIPGGLVEWKWDNIFRARLSYLKLHGSLNWFACHKCAHTIQILSPDDPAVYLKVGLKCSHCGSDASPLLVPPTWNKGFADKFILLVWRRALQEMLEAGRLIIVGYSFPKTDTFFRYLLGLALSLNDHLFEVVVINKSDEAKPRYSELFAPYFYAKKVEFVIDTFVRALYGTSFQRVASRIIPAREYRVPVPN